MIIDNKRLQSLRNKNFIEIQFTSTISVDISAGGAKLLVSDIIIPLDDEQTKPQWTFYYRHADTKGWYAMRWSQGQPETLKLLRNLTQKLF